MGLHQGVYDIESKEARGLDERFHLDVSKQAGGDRDIVLMKTSEGTTYALTISGTSEDAREGYLTKCERPLSAGVIVSVSSSLEQ